MADNYTVHLTAFDFLHSIAASNTKTPVKSLLRSKWGTMKRSVPSYYTRTFQGTCRVYSL